MSPKTPIELVDSLRSSDTKIILTLILNQFEDFKELLKAKDKEIVELRSVIGQLKKSVNRLTDELDEENAYVRRDTLLITGKPVPYGTNEENTSDTVIKVLKDNLNVEITPGDINCSHRLGKQNREGGPDKRPIIVKLVRRSLKRELTMKSRTVQKNIAAKERLYINESLTPKRRAILQSIVKMKKMEGTSVTGCTSLDGSVCAFTKNPMTGGRDRKHIVNTHEQLMKFCEEFVNKPLELFLENWKF